MATAELDVTDDSRQLQAIASLPPDLMLLKMENETIMAAARVQPRDPMKIVEQLKALIDAYPAAADEAIYSKPVGTVMAVTCHCGIKYEAPIKWENRRPIAIPEDCPNCGEWKPKDQQTVKKFAEGLSIRAAESIRSIFGYTRLATTTEILADGRAKVTGVLVDYAAGNVTSDERIVSPYFTKAKGGATAKVAEDRFLNVIVKAEKSKLRRDVILDSTPNIVKACFRDACENKLRELVPEEVVQQKIIPAFAEHGITVEHLEKIVGRPRRLGWRESERLELKKILRALLDGETTAAELMEGLQNDNKATDQGGVTMDDLTGGTTSKKTDQPKAPKEEAPEEPPQTPAEQPEEPPADAPGGSRLQEDASDAWDSLTQAEQKVFHEHFRNEFDAAETANKITRLENKAKADTRLMSKAATTFLTLFAAFRRDQIKAASKPAAAK